MTIEPNTHGTGGCKCLQHSVLLESVVVTLTIVSLFAITGKCLISYDLITVPKTSLLVLSEAVSTNVTDTLNTTSTPNTTSTISVNSTNETSNTTSGTSATTSTSTNLHPETSNKAVVRILENEDVLDILEDIFRYTSLAIAVAFVVEIVTKIATLYKFMLGKPWQIFDTIVVFANLAVVLAFYFVSVSTALYTVTYIVALRLWRIPYLCSINAMSLREALEEDRVRRRKVEERCIRLEDKLSYQADAMKKLQTLLPTSVLQENEFTNGALPSFKAKPTEESLIYQSTFRHFSIKNGTSATKESKSTPELRSFDEVPESKKSQAIFDTKDINVFCRMQGDDKTKVTQRKLHDEIELVVTRRRYKSLDHLSDVIELTDLESKDSRGIQSAFVPYSAVLPEMKQTSASAQSSPRLPGHRHVKSRKRRSSTSEYIDVVSRNSSADFKKDFPESEDSGSVSGANENNKTVEQSLNQEQMDNTSDVFDESVSSIAPLPNTTGNTELLGHMKRRKRLKRYPSCPEYACTQRMSITSEDLLLIEDDDCMSINDSTYDNSAFACGDDNNIQLHVLAEHDGTKTYRSEDGTPLTSL